MLSVRSVDGLQDPYVDPDNDYSDDIFNLHQPNSFSPHKVVHTSRRGKNFQREIWTQYD